MRLPTPVYTRYRGGFGKSFQNKSKGFLQGLSKKEEENVMPTSVGSSRPSLLAQLDSRWLAAGLAATGTGGLMLAPQSAEASIVWSGPVNINIPSTTAGIYLNVVSGVSGGSSTPSWDVNPWSSSTLSYFNPSSPSGGVYVRNVGNTAVANLPFGAMIGATPDGGRVFGSGAATTSGNDPHILNSSDNLIGFRFVDPSLGGGTTTHYGWMRISLADTLQGQPRAIVEYAYEDSGAAIPAGVPEPASLGMLALGAAGIVARRRFW